MSYSDEQRARDYRAAFSTEAGERVLADLVTACHILKPIPPGDALASAFAEGERNVALRIFAFLHYTPAQFRRLPQQVDEVFGNDPEA